MIAADRLRGIVDELERHDAQIAEHNAGKSEIYKRARSFGFDVATIRKLIAERRLIAKKGADAVLEAGDLLDVYREALASVGTPIATRVRVREALPAHHPDTGEILESGAPLPAAPVAPGPAEGTAAAPDTDPPAVCPIREDGRPDAIRTSDPGTSTAGGPVLSPTAAAIGLPTFLRRVKVPA